MQKKLLYLLLFLPTIHSIPLPELKPGCFVTMTPLTPFFGVQKSAGLIYKPGKRKKSAHTLKLERMKFFKLVIDNKYEEVQAMLKAGFDPHFENDKAIRTAAGDQKMLTVLREHGKVDFSRKTDYSLICESLIKARKPSLNVITFLVEECNAPVCLPGRSPLAVAAYKKEHAIAQYLMEHGASADAVHNSPQFCGSATAIAQRLRDTKMDAILEGKTHISTLPPINPRYLLKSGADRFNLAVDLKDYDEAERTLRTKSVDPSDSKILVHVVKGNKLEPFELLKKYGSTFKADDRSLVVDAIYTSPSPISLKFLVENGASVMGMGEEYKHQVPIAYAAYMRKTKIVAYLLYHGASPDERNTGQFAGSAVEIAKRLGDTKMLAVLESKGKSTLDT